MFCWLISYVLTTSNPALRARYPKSNFSQQWSNDGGLHLCTTGREYQSCCFSTSVSWWYLCELMSNSFPGPTTPLRCLRMPSYANQRRARWGSVMGWPENGWYTSALGWRPTERLPLLWEVHCGSKGEMSQAARDSTSGELSYQFVQDETYQPLCLLIIEESVGFKGQLVIRFWLL